MIQQKKRILFTPGMQCPGGCGRILNTRDDLHSHSLVLCTPCGDKHRAEIQRQRRAKAARLCAKCQRKIGEQSKLCRKCNAPSMRAAQPAPKAGEYRAFPSLRGPGGEMEAERELGRPYMRRRGQSGGVV